MRNYFFKYFGLLPSGGPKELENVTQELSFDSLVDKRDRKFWDWAFYNAPKALLDKTFTLLYSNLHTQYEKLNK